MIDYHGEHIALSVFTSALTGSNFPDAVVADAQQRSLAAVAAEGGHALLGAFVWHLLGHAASDEAELVLLRRAADLWNRASALCTTFGTIRADVEGAMENAGAPDSADRFNAAAVQAQDLANTVNAMREEIDALRTDALGFPHLPSHPRQDDHKTDTWDWGNLAIARRTDAFVRTLFRLADDDWSRAFAVGATAAYGANAAGSAYVGHTVGGPRRTHRYRDRIARNAVGSWLATHHPAAIAPTAMAQQIMFGPAHDPVLPGEVESLVHTALAHTFDLNRTVALPDLRLGYRRLVEHLTLLDGFALPPVPTPPGQTWMAVLYGDPQNPPPSLRPQDVDVVGQDGGGVAVQMGPPQPGSPKPNDSDSSKASKGCGIAILAIILIDVVQAFVQCIGQWANHHTCTYWKNMLLSKLWEQDPPNPRDSTRPQNPSVTAQQLTVVASSPEAAQLVSTLFDAHSQMWEAMDRAYAFLSVTGLIYPGHLVTLPLYAQFTSAPPPRSWPHREEANPLDTYHLYPVSPLENPIAGPSLFPTEAPPDVYVGQFEAANATQIALHVWRQIAADEHDSQNLDLDADRGYGHACWATNGSVHDDPVAVAILRYDEQ